jgi:apolipoprotein N-acyltransferase
VKAIVCVLLSAVSFYFSLGLGSQWWLAWFAPVPILWLAFTEQNGGRVFIASVTAMALGGTSLLRAYAGHLPIFVLVLSIGGSALAFAASVRGARSVKRALGPVAATFAFAAIWSSFDFLASFVKAGGTIGTPAVAEVGMPALIQIASVVGYLGITFLLGVVSAGIAASLSTRRLLPAAIAIALLVANVIFGLWRMSAPLPGTLRVALVESDDIVGQVRGDDRAATLQAIDAYAAAIDGLHDSGVQLIVLPEDISYVAPQWRTEAQARLAAAADRAHATLVAGFGTSVGDARRNVSWAFKPGTAEPVTYEKRHLVPVLESAVYTPGPGPKVLPNGIGLEICKDMDYQAMLRSDTKQTKPLVLAVPAWDFGKDGWTHARVAMLRSVENAVPMARTARYGLLTLNDRYGRLVARATTVGRFTVLVGDLPIDGRGGNTVYDAIGDVFGWLSVVVSVGLVAGSLATRTKAGRTK